MFSDKQLIRDGNYQQALGGNFSSNPYSLVAVNGSPILDIPEQVNKFSSHSEAYNWGIQNDLKGKWVVFNANADWL